MIMGRKIAVCGLLVQLPNLCTFVDTFETVNSNINVLNLISRHLPGPPIALIFITKERVWSSGHSLAEVHPWDTDIHWKEAVIVSMFTILCLLLLGLSLSVGFILVCEWGNDNWETDPGISQQVWSSESHCEGKQPPLLWEVNGGRSRFFCFCFSVFLLRCFSSNYIFKLNQ
jgi:hypothetical protein